MSLLATTVLKEGTGVAIVSVAANVAAQSVTILAKSTFILWCRHHLVGPYNNLTALTCDDAKQIFFHLKNTIAGKLRMRPCIIIAGVLAVVAASSNQFPSDTTSPARLAHFETTLRSLTGEDAQAEPYERERKHMERRLAIDKIKDILKNATGARRKGV